MKDQNKNSLETSEVIVYGAEHAHVLPSGRAVGPAVIKCPKCKAKNGYPCETVTGVYVKVHNDRADRFRKLMVIADRTMV